MWSCIIQEKEKAILVCINPLTLIRKDLHSVPSVNQALFINREKKVKVVKVKFIDSDFDFAGLSAIVKLYFKQNF